MTSTQADAIPIDPSQLQPGVYVWLDMKWMDHPFLTNRFMVSKDADVAVIQSLGAEGHLYYLPAKSTVEPLPLGSMLPAADDTNEAQQLQLALELERQRLAMARRDRIRQVKDAAARADRAWESAASATREALGTLARSPRMAAKHLENLSKETAAAISSGPQALLHLLGPKEDQGPQFHALNVMTLCMLLGKKLGLSEQELTDLSMAALAHDAGKAAIPLSILKNGQRKKHEEDHYRLHVKHSVELARESGVFTRKAIEMIEQHHEAVDGSGWPKHITDMSVGSRILAMCNRYDRLCSPESPDHTPLMPSEALAHMLRQEGSKYDAQMLATLIKLLGVYPPGTVVRLNDNSLALVVSPGQSIQRPQVLLYAPDVGEVDAPLLDLARSPDLSVVETIRPVTLPPEVLQWLNPQKRLACFFSVEEA
ncbi:MAG TPA: DUF3391 domain-containing protein [Burkholderiaceae bacterium]|nr:DUF3391 domain-containing protein [Burkholderiaceae bacterium]